MHKIKQNLQEVRLFLRLKGTAITRVYWVWLLYTFYVGVVVGIHIELYPHLGLADNLVTVLGIVISLLLGFRANNSVARYKEARAHWVTIKQTVRNVSKIIWTVVPAHDAKDVIIKKSAINLLDGFAFAVKHYLREEYSYEEKDLKERIQHVPRFATQGKLSFKKMMHKYDKALCVEFKPPTHIPMEMIYALNKYVQNVGKKYTAAEIPPMIWMGVTQAIGGLEGIVTNLERLQRTPIPLAYKAHLTQSFWIYLLAMPFQLVNILEWWTIPILGFASFFFEGVLSLSDELEDPFGYDYNDLPLDAYCWVIRRELGLTTASKLPDPDDWMLADTNKPFLPLSELSGEELASKSKEEIITILQNLKSKPNNKIKTREEWAKESGNVSPGSTGSDNPMISRNGPDQV